LAVIKGVPDDLARRNTTSDATAGVVERLQSLQLVNLALIRRAHPVIPFS
jgi:hypothetical protein